MHFQKMWSLQRHIVTSEKLQCHLRKIFNILFCNIHRAAMVLKGLNGRKGRFNSRDVSQFPLASDKLHVPHQAELLSSNHKNHNSAPSYYSIQNIFTKSAKEPYGRTLLIREICSISKGQTQQKSEKGLWTLQQ